MSLTGKNSCLPWGSLTLTVGMGQVHQARRSLALWAPEGLVRHVGGHSEALLKKLNQQNQQAVAVLSGWEGNSSAGHWKEEFGSHSLPTEGLQVGLQNMAPWWTIPAHSCPPSIFHALGKRPWRYSPLSWYARKCHSDARNTTFVYVTTKKWANAGKYNRSGARGICTLFSRYWQISKIISQSKMLRKTAQLQNSVPLDLKMCLSCSAFPLELVWLVAKWSYHQGWQ